MTVAATESVTFSEWWCLVMLLKGQLLPSFASDTVHNSIYTTMVISIYFSFAQYFKFHVTT